MGSVGIYMIYVICSRCAKFVPPRPPSLSLLLLEGAAHEVYYEPRYTLLRH